MSKKTFNISASAENGIAQVRIIGEIGWDTDSNDFRAQVEALAGQGIRDAHIYMFGPGGSCFHAAEIVNIMQDAFPGTITGEGGALIASAYTYIAAHCDTFSMPSNGLFMIHKPKGGEWGTADEMESYVKALRAIEQEYLDTYKAKAINEEELLKRWGTSDWWLTAEEAKAQGFITEVRSVKKKIDAETAAIIAACGCPSDKIESFINQQKDKMDTKKIAVSLGLDENATEEAIIAKAGKFPELAKTIQTLTGKIENLEANLETYREKEKEVKAQAADAIIVEAIKDGRINDDSEGKTRAAWKKRFEADFDDAKELLESLPKHTPASATFGNGTDGDVKSAWEERMEAIKKQTGQ